MRNLLKVSLVVLAFLTPAYGQAQLLPWRQQINERLKALEQGQRQAPPQSQPIIINQPAPIAPAPTPIPAPAPSLPPGYIPQQQPQIIVAPQAPQPPIIMQPAPAPAPIYLGPPAQQQIPLGPPAQQQIPIGPPAQQQIPIGPPAQQPIVLGPPAQQQIPLGAPANPIPVMPKAGPSPVPPPVVSPAPAPAPAPNPAPTPQGQVIPLGSPSQPIANPLPIIPQTSAEPQGYQRLNRWQPALYIPSRCGPDCNCWPKR